MRRRFVIIHERDQDFLIGRKTRRRANMHGSTDRIFKEAHKAGEHRRQHSALERIQGTIEMLLNR